MAQAKDGDKVRIHYTGKLDDGTVFDTSEGAEPLEFTVGSGAVIAGFDKAVRGMSVNESKTVTIPCAEAYGEPREDLVLKVPHAKFPPHLIPEIGQTFEMEDEEGVSMTVTVTDVSDEGVTLDANHPLAGEDLTFDLTLVSIN